ncbi:hypothetical protein BDZ94DRAFT_1189745 [Collybia nuda]|uniref:Ketoreductase (KR) domain-containing protein n=1 Tax=Collybia nuda TaxID=64659 RepID=A0A9P5Y9K2_9AGAR|nr:hypothetical protein BDZ94DRAFT_1189745 [Collybia nuda]
MVLSIAWAAFTKFFPTEYAVHIVAAIGTVLVFRAFSQGRKTNRERDLHARVILVTGGFTPLGLTLLQSLAQRGAHIIALSPHPIDSPRVSILITLLRSTFSNEQIFAEQCDLNSPSSIRAFCTKFLTGQEQRLDAIVYAHEYQHIGSVGYLSRTQTLEEASSKREASSLSTFLMTTLLLPALLVAPVERDIRIITVVNPFYAAAVGPSHFALPFSSQSSEPPKSSSVFLQEGIRSLRTSIFTRHLQRILDALPTAQVPKTDDASSAVPVVSSKVQKSNIVAVSVSPGISRVDTMAPLLSADWATPGSSTVIGIILYLLLQPLLRIFTKAPSASLQTVLHVLFLPTPFKILAQSEPKSEADKTKASVIDESLTEIPEEVLKPGSLYADCAVVKLKVPVPASADQAAPDQRGDKAKGKGKGKEKVGAGLEDVIEIPDDGEFGGEVTGRLVWEAYEEALKTWEKANPPGSIEESAVGAKMDKGLETEGNAASHPGVNIT